MLDEDLLLVEEPLPVDGHGGGRQASVERTPAPQAGDLSGANQDLGRQTSHIHTGAANQTSFDDRHLRAEFGSLDRRRDRGGATADDGEATGVVAAHAAGLGVPTLADTWDSATGRPGNRAE